MARALLVDPNGLDLPLTVHHPSPEDPDQPRCPAEGPAKPIDTTNWPKPWWTWCVDCEIPLPEAPEAPVFTGPVTIGADPDAKPR